MGFVVRLEGTLFEGINDQNIVSQFLNLNQMLAVLGKDLGSRLGLWCTFHRRKIDFSRDLSFKTQFTRQFYDKYMAKFNKKDYFENIYYISGVLKHDDLDDAISEAHELIEKIKTALNEYDPEVLGVYENQNGVMFSEIYEFFGSLINGGFEQIPLNSQDAYTTIASANLHFGNELLEIRAPRRTRYAMLYDLKDFGQTKMMVLNPVLDLPCEFVFTQSFVYIGSIAMQKQIDDQLNKLESVGDLAKSQQTEMIEAKGHLAAGELMFGDYHGALVVYGETPKETVHHAQRCTSRFLNAGGFRFIPATLSAPTTFFSQVPGAKGMPRPFPKATTNLAASFGMYNYAHGKSRGNPIGDGSAIMPLETVAGTLYDFNFHLTDEKTDNIGEKAAGHTLILGKTGTGKTTLQTALLSFAERFDPFIFAVDLDRGMEIWIRALGGSYFALEAGKPTGLNPFQLPDTPKNRDFLYDLVGACLRIQDKELTAEEVNTIKSAVDTVMELDFEHRRFSAMMQIIPETYQENSLRTRLSMWCGEDSRYGWCLDNPTNLFDPEDFWRIGFDCTDILKDNYRPTEPVLAYLFHLKYLMLQKVNRLGGICASIVEEFWHPARYPMTQELILKALKTGRKLGEFMVLVSQSPEDAISVPIFPAIVQQTVTKLLLPNPDAQWEGYSKIGLSQKEFDEFIKLGDKSRTLLIKQSKQSSFAKLALPSEFEDEIAVLSGDAANVYLMQQAMEHCGSERPDDWLPVFQEMRRERKRQRTEKEKGEVTALEM